MQALCSWSLRGDRTKPNNHTYVCYQLARKINTSFLLIIILFWYIMNTCSLNTCCQTPSDFVCSTNVNPAMCSLLTNTHFMKSTAIYGTSGKCAHNGYWILQHQPMLDIISWGTYTCLLLWWDHTSSQMIFHGCWSCCASQESSFDHLPHHLHKTPCSVTLIDAG